MDTEDIQSKFEAKFLSMKDRVASWNDSSQMESHRIEHDGRKIRPEDSRSQTKSYASHRSQSSKGSRSSRIFHLNETILRTSMKRPALLVEASMMEKTSERYK